SLPPTNRLPELSKPMGYAESKSTIGVPDPSKLSGVFVARAFCQSAAENALTHPAELPPATESKPLPVYKFPAESNATPADAPPILVTTDTTDEFVVSRTWTRAFVDETEFAMARYWLSIQAPLKSEIE